MADNVVLNSGSGGETAATDDCGGLQYQRVKLTDGTPDSTTHIAAGGGVEAVALRVTIASDSTGVVSVDDNGGSITVDAASLPLPTGAATSANQDTQTTHLATVAGAVAGTEMQVDIVSSALPTGAATAAKQPALGTAGTPSTDVISIQGVASGTVVPVSDGGGSLTVDGTVAVSGTVTVGSHAVTNAGTFATQVDGAALTALQLIDNVVAVEDAVAGTGYSGIPLLVVRQDSHSDLAADGDFISPTVDADGGLRVSIVAGAGSGGTAAADDADFTAGATSGTPVMGVYESSPTSVTDGDLGTVGITATRALKVAIASGGVAGIAEDSASAGGEEGIMMLAVRRDAASSGVSADGDFAALSVTSDGSLRVGSHAVTNAGTFVTQENGAALTALQVIDNPVIVDDAAFTPATTSVMMAGFQADETATDSVDEGDGGAARMTLDRKQIVTLAPHTAGGPSIFRSLDIDESEEEIKASAGQIYWVHAMNMVATARYLKFYNATAASVTVGTTTPVLTLPIPANSTTGAGFVFNVPQGIPFGTAISVACTTGVADADTGAPGANDVIINVGYA